MKLKMSGVLCGLVLTGAVSYAQPQVPASDLISGTWVGKAAPDGAAPDSSTITLTLKFDGRTVTGTGGPSGAPQSGIVTAGTFDAKTGAVRLEVEIKDDSGPTKAVLDGILFDNTFLGRMTLGPNTGRFHFVKAPVAAAAPPAASGSAAILGKGFDEVSGWIAKAADAVPADKYNYRPVGTVRTFGQLVAHLADSYAYYCGSAKAGSNIEWTDTVEKAGGDKTALTAKLKAATDGCAAVYANATTANAPPLMANIAHSNLHYGNIVTYMRMLGLTPPSS